MAKNFSKFYCHDIDEEGLPYTCPVNPTTTMFMLKASNAACLAAITLVNDALINKSYSDREYFSVKAYTIGDCFIIEIFTNNFIPQLYEDIKAIEGVEKLHYTLYDTAYGRLISDHNSWSNSVIRAKKLDVVRAIDDEPMFPEEFELSLPETYEP